MTTFVSDAEVRRFSDYLVFLDRRGRKAQTLESYKDAHKGFCSFVARIDGIECDLARTSGADLRAWKSEMLKAGRAPATINHRLLAIRAYAAWAVRFGGIAQDQLESISAIPLIESPALGAVTMTADERRRFVRGVELSRNRRDSAIVFLLLNGLRVGEVAGLRVDDVKVTLTRGQVEVHGEHTKRSSRRFIPLTPRARHYLHAYLAEAKPVGRVFVGQRGDLTTAGIDKIVRRYGREVGLEVHPHRLRHQFAADYLAENPADLVGLQKILGHASLETTARHYARRRLVDLESGVNKIDQ